MSIIDGYSMGNGGYYKTSDMSGPYSIADDGTATLLGTGGGSGGGGTPENPMVVDWYGFPGLSSENTPLQVMPMYNTAGNLPAIVVAGGDTWTPLPSQAVTKLVLSNETGVTLLYKQLGGDGVMPVRDGMETEIMGIDNCDQISVKRADSAEDPVELYARLRGVNNATLRNTTRR